MGYLDNVARQRLKDWLQTSGETQTHFGERIGRNQAWMSRYLDAEFDADLDTLTKMADAQQLTLWQLLDVSATDASEEELVRRFRALTPIRRELVLNMVREWQPVTGRRSR